MKQLGFSSVGENLAKGLFDLMEKFLKFRINGWPVYKASSLLVHCPLISGKLVECSEPTSNHLQCSTRNQNSKIQNPKPKFQYPKSGKLLELVLRTHQQPPPTLNTKPKFQKHLQPVTIKQQPIYLYQPAFGLS